MGERQIVESAQSRRRAGWRGACSCRSSSRIWIGLDVQGPGEKEKRRTGILRVPVKEPHNSTNAAYIRSKIRERIRSASVTICLIGENDLEKRLGGLGNSSKPRRRKSGVPCAAPQWRIPRHYPDGAHATEQARYELGHRSNCSGYRITLDALSSCRCRPPRNDSCALTSDWTARLTQRCRATSSVANSVRPIAAGNLQVCSNISENPHPARAGCSTERNCSLTRTP